MSSLANLSGVATCSALPLIVTATSLSGAGSADGAASSRVAVTYQTPQLFPLPGMTGRLTVTRTVELRVRN